MRAANSSLCQQVASRHSLCGTGSFQIHLILSNHPSCASRGWVGHLLLQKAATHQIMAPLRRCESPRENPLILPVHKLHAVHPQVIVMFATTILYLNRHSNYKPRRPLPRLARLPLRFPWLDEFRVRNALALYQYTNRQKPKMNGPSRSKENADRAKVFKIFLRKNLSLKAPSDFGNPLPPSHEHHRPSPPLQNLESRYLPHLGYQSLDSHRGTRCLPLVQVPLQLGHAWFHDDYMDLGSVVQGGESAGKSFSTSVVTLWSLRLTRTTRMIS